MQWGVSCVSSIPSCFFLTLSFLSFLSLSFSRSCYSFISACAPENRMSESLPFRFVENNAIKAEHITLVKLLICVSGAPGLSIGQETKYPKGLCGFLRSVQSNTIIFVPVTPNCYFQSAKSAFSVI